jgi:hypothetical protein
MSAGHHFQPARRDDGAEEHADPIGTTAGQGTPRPNTGLDTGRTDAPGANDTIPDPDYGMDPRVPNVTYGGTDRGTTTAIDTALQHREGLEMAPARGNAAAPGTTGQLRGGDTTSTANTHEDMAHGLGESGTTGAMGEGVRMPGAADRASGRPSGVDPNDESTFEEGQQFAQGRRA